MICCPDKCRSRNTNQLRFDSICRIKDKCREVQELWKKISFMFLKKCVFMITWGFMFHEE